MLKTVRKVNIFTSDLRQFKACKVINALHHEMYRLNYNCSYVLLFFMIVLFRFSPLLLATYDSLEYELEKNDVEEFLKLCMLLLCIVLFPYGKFACTAFEY